MGFSADILSKIFRRKFGYAWRLVSLFFCVWLIMAWFMGHPPYWGAVGWLSGIVIADLLKYAFNE